MPKVKEAKKVVDVVSAASAVPVAKFNPAGGTISARVSSGFAQPGSYGLFLWEVNQNKILMEQQGNFLNSADDEYPLPGSNSAHQGRHVQALVTVAITPPELHYAIGLTVFQDGKALASDLKTGSADAGTAVTRTLWIRLEAQ